MNLLGVKPSYATGFAQWPGMSEYPQLWTGLAGAWAPFLGGTGNKVFDLSGNGRHGTLVADTHWVPGKFGSALSFDGTDDSVAIPIFNLTTNWTIIVWAKNDPAATDDTMFGNDADGENYFQPFDGTRARFENSVGANVNWTADTDFNGRWRQYTLIGHTTQAELYLDAISQGKQSITPSLEFCNIGTGHNVATVDYFGIIANVMLYNRVLLSGEVALLYQIMKRYAA